ncbi:SDR family oxidoreductase [Pseudomonas sp. Marseille-QA0892]
MGKLDGKIAIITGSDSGMGQAMAIAFAREGAKVAVTYRSDEEGAQETLRLIREAGSQGMVKQVDVIQEQQVVQLFQAVADILGTPDVLVNNAGTGKSAPLRDLSYEEFDKVVKTDLYGPFFCAREFVKYRERAGGAGKMINVTSVHDSIPSPNNVPYGAAKGGLLAMTRSLALELAPMKINVNAIAPGLIYTPMTSQRLDDPEERDKELPNIPWKRAGKPEEIASMAVYLASEAADYVTGQSFVIDGGLEMNWGQGA